MNEKYNIAGYVRISVDDELDRDNVSIENQKSIISAFVKEHFSGSSLTFYEDRDRSGYTFDQRPGYQKMRKNLVSHEHSILIIKDFSRFSRRNSRGLVELEDLRDIGIRIISIGDNIDFPNDDDWLKIQFQFLINEMPVTDTSKKVRNVIKRRQLDGKWICSAPYGYTINNRKEFEIVPVEAETIRLIYSLYNEKGWGYRKISNYLTEQQFPTPRMSQKMQKEAKGESCKLKPKTAWSIITIQEILDNDFYIGTFRQHKYTREKINGKDVLVDKDENIVIEHHHQSIIDYRTFALTQSLRQKRTKTHYTGIKKNDNVYSGYIYCGDCGNPMFAVSQPKRPPAYICGSYQRRGLKGCSGSHHIRVDKLDELLKLYIQRIQENSQDMLAELDAELKREPDEVSETKKSADNIAEVLCDLRKELKETKRQRIRDIIKNPNQEKLIAETYDEIESELQQKIEGFTNQIQMLSERRNTIIQVNRATKTVLDIFQDIIQKEKLDKQDVDLIVDKITVYTNRIEIKLRNDVSALLHLNKMENLINFNQDTKNHAEFDIVQRCRNQRVSVFSVNDVSEGDPSLTILTQDEKFIWAILSLIKRFEQNTTPLQIFRGGVLLNNTQTCCNVTVITLTYRQIVCNLLH